MLIQLPRLLHSQLLFPPHRECFSLFCLLGSNDCLGLRQTRLTLPLDYLLHLSPPIAHFPSSPPLLLSLVLPQFCVYDGLIELLPLSACLPPLSHSVDGGSE